MRRPAFERAQHTCPSQGRGEILFLEQIPHPVTLTQLHHNEQTFAQLASLHNTNYQPDFAVKNHGWSLTDIDEALSVLCLPEAANEKIRHIQQVGHELFEEQCLISGIVMRATGYPRQW